MSFYNPFCRNRGYCTFNKIPKKYFNHNVQGTVNLLDNLDKSKVKNLYTLLLHHVMEKRTPQRKKITK